MEVDNIPYFHEDVSRERDQDEQINEILEAHAVKQSEVVLKGMDFVNGNQFLFFSN